MDVPQTNPSTPDEADSPPSTLSMAEYISVYQSLGWSLCDIPPGKKGPATVGWGDSPLPPGGEATTQGIGLIHGRSSTAAIDIDDLHNAEAWLAQHDICLSNLLEDDKSVLIESGRPNRKKLLYRLPPGLGPQAKASVKGSNGTDIIDFRCIPKGGGFNLQDVLPPTIHPDTRKPYEWGGNGDFRCLPELPPALLHVWQSLQRGSRPNNVPEADKRKTNGRRTEGGRNNYLFQLGGDLAKKGLNQRSINAALQAINSEECDPPLAPSEVNSTAASAARNSRGAKEASIRLLDPHPLTIYQSFAETPKPPRWVIPGFIAMGVSIIAGGPGVGKTTNIAPLAMIAAGLHEPNNPLAPKNWRHVVYITEDPEQLHRIIIGVIKHGRKGISLENVRERMHIVDAKRLPPATVAIAGAEYRATFTRQVGGVEHLPLVVIDTMSATLEMENENDNSEASSAIAIMKQGFAGLPLWIVTHLAKTDLGRIDVLNLTPRGASAFAGDAHQILFMVIEKGVRYLARGKTRFEARWQELQFTATVNYETVPNEFGDLEEVALRWGWPTPMEPEEHTKATKEAVTAAKEQAAKEAEDGLRRAILSAVEAHWEAGTPLNKTGVRAAVTGNSTAIGQKVDQLAQEGWLHEIEVPSQLRISPSKKSFYVALSAQEQTAYLKEGTAALPHDKLEIPPSWRRSELPDLANPTEREIESD